MVKKILKVLAYFLFFMFALMVFIPKANLYYLGEENLKKFDVVISNETLHEHIFSLSIEDLQLSVKGIKSGVIEEVDIGLFIIYNSISVRNIQLSSLVESYLPSKVEALQITYSLLSPLSIQLQGHGEFGEIQASFTIHQRVLHVELQPKKIMLTKYKKSLKQFKKNESGVYVYAKTF